MRVESDDRDESPLSKNPRRFGQRLGRIARIGENIEQRDVVERSGDERKLVHIAECKLHVAGAAETLLRSIYHPVAAIQTRYGARALSEESRHDAVSRSYVQDVAERGERENAVRERFPGASRRVV